jgi:peptidoglycan hydrolase CwlO-like protein
MEVQYLLTTIGGLMLAIIGFFLKQTMEELKTIKETTYETKTKVQVLENDYLNKIYNLNDRFDMLNSSLEKLTKNIEELNKRIK